MLVFLLTVLLMADVSGGGTAVAGPSYAEFHREVVSGLNGYLYVGVPVTGHGYMTRCYVPELAGFKSGVYFCYKDGDKCLMRPVAVAAVPQSQPPVLYPPCLNNRCPRR